METPDADTRAQIVRNHILPRIGARLGIETCLSDAALEVVLDGHCKEGMRGVEKDADHVLAEAQLALALADDADKRAEVLDADGKISAKFARTRLKRAEHEAWDKIASMYT